MLLSVAKTGNTRPLCFHGAWPERGQCIHEARQHGRRHHGAMDDRLLAPGSSSAGRQTTYPGYVPDLAILVPGGRPAIQVMLVGQQVTGVVDVQDDGTGTVRRGLGVVGFRPGRPRFSTPSCKLVIPSPCIIGPWT